MKTRAILGLVAVAGMATAASAQSVTFTWNWKNAATNDQTPLSPGQSAKIWLDVAYTPEAGGIININGVDHTVRGLGTVFFDLLGANDTSGSWTLDGGGFNGTANPSGANSNVNFANYGRRQDFSPTFAPWGWATGDVGTVVAAPMNPGFTVGSIQAGSAGQFPLPGSTINHYNPVAEIWRGAWEPADYSARTVTFTGRKADASPNTGASLYVQAGTASPIAYHVPMASVNFGSVQIPIIPSPSSLALLGLGGLIVARRRR